MALANQIWMCGYASSHVNDLKRNEVTVCMLAAQAGKSSNTQSHIQTHLLWSHVRIKDTNLFGWMCLQTSAHVSSHIYVCLSFIQTRSSVGSSSSITWQVKHCTTAPDMLVFEFFFSFVLQEISSAPPFLGKALGSVSFHPPIGLRLQQVATGNNPQMFQIHINLTPTHGCCRFARCTSMMLNSHCSIFWSLWPLLDWSEVFRISLTTKH